MSRKESSFHFLPVSPIITHFHFNGVPFLSVHHVSKSATSKTSCNGAFPSSAPSRSFPSPVGFLLWWLLPGKEGLAPSPQMWLMMVVKMAQVMLMITVDTSKS